MSTKKSDNNKGFFNRVKGFFSNAKPSVAFIVAAIVGAIATGGIGGLLVCGLAGAYVSNSDTPKQSLYALGAAAIAGGLLLGPIGAGLAVSGFILRKPIRNLVNNFASSRNADQKQRNPNTQPQPKDKDNVNIQQSKAKSLEQPKLHNTKIEETNKGLQPESQLQQALKSQSVSMPTHHSIPSNKKSRNNNVLKK